LSWASDEVPIITGCHRGHYIVTCII
jgi:hypothetical protein